MPKKQSGTVSFQTKFLGWDHISKPFILFFPSFLLSLLSISNYFLLNTYRWRQPRLVYWSPSLTSIYQIYKKSMISWSSKSTNLVLIIDVLVSDHQTPIKAFFKVIYIHIYIILGSGVSSQQKLIDFISFQFFFYSGIFDTIWSSIHSTKPSGCGMYNRSWFRV